MAGWLGVGGRNGSRGSMNRSWEQLASATSAEAEAVPAEQAGAPEAAPSDVGTTAVEASPPSPEVGSGASSAAPGRSLLRRLRGRLPSALSEDGTSVVAGLVLCGLLVSRGANVGLETAGLAANEPFYLPLYRWLVGAYDGIAGVYWPLETPGHYDLLAALQILGGMAAAWWLGRCLRESFALPTWGAPAGALLLLLPYFFGPVPLGNTIGIAALAYPLYLVSLCFLLQGFARADWRRLMGFLLLMPTLMLSAEPFIFFCPAFLVVLAWLLKGYPGPRGPKLALLGLFLAALVSVFLLERLVNLAERGRFAAAPVSGIHKIVAPLYLSDVADEQLFLGEPRLRALYHAFQSRMAARNLRRVDAVNGLVPAPELVGHYQASYSPIMHDVVLPILEQRGRRNWFEIDEVTRTIGWRLLRDKPAAWFSLTFDSMIYGFGGFYPTVFLLAAFGLVGYVQIQRRDALSLVLGTVLLFHLTNVFMAALLGNPPRAAALYSEPAVMVLLLAGLTRLLLGPAGEEAVRGGGNEQEGANQSVDEHP